jgi:short-subunit dehydrogenase
MGRLQGKTVFITGASSGIGAAIGRYAAEEGASVVLVARRLGKLESVAEDIRRGGGRVLVVEADVTCDGDLERAAAEARAAFGGIDVVVANAGFGVAGRLESLELADYRRQLETNVFGVLRTVYATLGELKRSRGCLAIIGSVAGHLPAPGNSAYAMSKAAVGALSLSLRSELSADKIAVVLVSPGFVESEIRLVDNHGRPRPGVRDAIPTWLRMPAAHAAVEIIDAIVKRERERVLTRHGKVMVLLTRVAPGLVTGLARLGAKVPRRR